MEFRSLWLRDLWGRHVTVPLRVLMVMGACLLAVQSVAWGDSFYVRADGTAAQKSDATGCSSPSTSMNLSTHNQQRFNPGDTIVLCNEGGEFRARLVVQASGTAGFPITYEGGGSAVLSGSDLVDDWARLEGSVYVARLLVEPRQVFVNGVFGVRKSSQGELSNDFDWFWSENRLFLRSSVGNPDSVFDNPGVEASARTFCLDLGGRDHVVVSGITARHSNSVGIGAWNPGSHLRIEENTVEWNWHNGIGLNGREPYSNIVIEGNTARYNGTGGIGLLGPGKDSIVRQNRCYSNGRFQSAGNEYDHQHRWTYGIKLWESTNQQEGNQIYQNDVYGNGRGESRDFQGRGAGIWIDMVRGKPSNPIIIRHNTVHDNKGNGIFIEISSNTVTYGNVLYNNASNAGGRNVFAPANIVVDAREDWVTENNLVYNNTSLGGRNGIKVVTYEQRSGCSVRNNIVRNNIVVGAREYNLYCDTGGDNDGVYGVGNKYTSNSFGAESSNFIRWNGANYDTYSSWESAYGESSSSINSDPGFADESENHLYLSATSPCRDAGANLGSEFDEGLLEESTWTAGVETADHDLHGDGWEVGAYIYAVGTAPRQGSPSGRRSPDVIPPP